MEIIPLGSTCSIAYQLKKLDKRKNAYPFDWVRINNFAIITSLIENNFEGFLDRESFKFDKISKCFLVKNEMKSYLYQTKFCKFFHEFNDYINDESFYEFQQKYKRRIKRLYSSINRCKKILFIREEIGNLSRNKINNFINLINKINPNLEWKLKIIVSKEQYLYHPFDNIEIIYSSQKVNDWRRPELDWESFFIY